MVNPFVVFFGCQVFFLLCSHGPELIVAHFVFNSKFPVPHGSLSVHARFASYGVDGRLS